jgi:hypothetical protein
VNLDGYHQLPLYFYGNRTTSTGIPFVYCPYGYGLASSNVSEVQNLAKDPYTVTLSNVISTNGKAYVLSSEEAPVAGVLAFIIVPRSGSNVPVCEDVGVNESSNFALTGDSEGKGSVYAINSEDLAYGMGDKIAKNIDSSGDDSELQDAFSEVSESPSTDALIIIQSGEVFTLSC